MSACACMGCPHEANCRCRCAICNRPALTCCPYPTSARLHNDASAFNYYHAPEYVEVKLFCYGGCGRRYGTFPDVHLPTALWNRIAVGPPFSDGDEKIDREGRGGVLCPACICERLAALPDCVVINVTIDGYPSESGMLHTPRPSVEAELLAGEMALGATASEAYASILRRLNAALAEVQS